MHAPDSQHDPITPKLLLRAYAAGLFPMAEDAEDEHLHWFDPRERGIFPLEAPIIPKSLQKTIRARKFEIRVDHDFDGVLAGCAASRPGREHTWINGRIARLFRDLFRMGHAHTVEAWRDGALVGGLYGLALNGAFFGESMFHTASDASKVCLIHLFARLNRGGFSLLDAQFVTPHLESLGAVEISRRDYRARLDAALLLDADFRALDAEGDAPETILHWARSGARVEAASPGSGA